MSFSRHATAIRGASSITALALGLLLAPAAVAQTGTTGQPGTATTQNGTPVPTETGNVPAVDASSQEVSTAPDPAAPDPQTPDNPQDIIVTGTRASLQSAIARKKNAGTVVDSIVADDIASFPDKNAGEALARVTGVQLQRSFGEGERISIRGVEPDLNRVEINGVSQQSALGQRGGDFRELQVELVKSIDVWKGYTVDLTEGGIGGTVSIETRRPLELTKPIFAIKAEGQYLDLSRSFKPRLNLTAGRNDLFDDRLGFIVNVTYNDVDTREDYASNTNWTRLADFDRSPNKTLANADYANFATYESCSGVSATPTTTLQAARLACETQFFDWAPSFYRYRQLDRNDKRVTADFQLQYRFADNFNVFGEAQVNNRTQQLKDTNYSVDFGRFERYNYDAALPTINGATSRPRITADTFTIDPDTHVVTSSISNYNGINAGTAAAPVYTGANSIVGVQRRDFSYDQLTQYYQGGFNWEVGRTKLIGFASTSKAKLTNNTNLVSISTGVSGITVDRRNDAGIPVLIFPESFDPANPADYANFNRRGRNGQLLVQAGPTLNYRPQQAGSSEDQLKLDVDFDTSDLPFLKRVEYGGQYRTQNYFQYGGGGARLIRPAVTAVPQAGIPASPAVFQTSANVTYNTVIGPVPATGPAADTYYFTPAQYQQFIAQNAGVTSGAPLFTGLQVSPDGAPSRLALPLFNYGNLAQYYDLSRFDQDLVREADGLPQIPTYIIDEDIISGYLKFNFEQELFGMRLTGNAGVRYTHTKDSGTSSNTIRNIRIRPGTGQTVNGVVIPAVIETVTTGVQQITLNNSYSDWLPAVNFNLEVLPELFVRGTYAKNLARPLPTDLSPSINCLFDNADQVAGQDTCTAGNPKLQPYRADQYDLNVAWYANRDTLISAGYYYKNVKSFVLRNQLRSGVDLFGDGQLLTVRQPINGFGAKLDGFEFSAQTAFTWLPAPFDGLGASGNFTYARALNSALTNQATGEPLEGFPGLSKFTYNASAFYDKDWLNLKVNWNRRSSWLLEAANAANSNNPIFRKGESFIDAKVLFRVSPNYSIWFEALNLGKEYSKTYIDAARPIEYSYFGQRFFVGAQIKL